MDESDKQQFANSFLSLCEVFEKNPSDLLMAAYHKAMGKYDMPQVERAISRAVVECKFFPKPVELIEFIDGKISDVAEIEAGKVLNAIKRHGSSKSVVFDDAVTQAVIVNGFGGWIKMGQELMSSEEKWFLKDFTRIYQAYARQNIKHVGHLPGAAELDNNANAGLGLGIEFKEPDPILIGDKQKALQIAHVEQPEHDLKARALITDITNDIKSV